MADHGKTHISIDDGWGTYCGRESPQYLATENHLATCKACRKARLAHLRRIMVETIQEIANSTITGATP